MRRNLWILGAVVVGLGALLTGCHVDGATFTVDTTSDTTDAAPGDGVCDDGTGACSLRAAVMEANALPGVDAVQLSSGTYTLTIPGTGEDAAATGDLDITEAVHISGVAAHATTVDAAGLDRVFHDRNDTSMVVLERLTITGGTGDGAAVRKDGAGILDLTWSEVTGNTATTAPVEATAGSALVWVATISGNTGVDAGAVAISGSATLDAAGSVLSGNASATADHQVALDGGSGIIRWSTVVGETGPGASGVVIDPGPGALSIKGSVVDGSCAAPLASQGANITRDATCALAGPDDAQGVDPLLGDLVDDGPLRVHVPAPDSPALDVTTGDCGVGFDARDVDRPQGAGCDAGAVEVRSFTVDDGGDTTDATPGDGTCDDGTGTCTLRAAIGETNALPGTDHVVVDPAVTTIALTRVGTGDTAGDLDITDGLILAGNDTTITQTVTGERVLQVTSAAPGFTATGLTVTGGDTAGGSQSEGGGLYLGAPTALTDVTVTGNTATTSGGGIRLQAAASFTRVAVTGNTAGSSGGGIAMANGSLTISDSTISGNTATDGGGLQGGPVSATNVTISGNTATAGTGGWRISGGPSQLLHSTVVANGGTTAANLRAQSSTAPLELTASIVGDPAGGNNCADSHYTSGGYNVIEGGSCAGLVPTDVTAAPVLGVLADNGGPTQTHLPSPSGPGMGIVPPGTAGLCDGTIATDQRGEARPQGGGCDAGAVEVVDVPAVLTVDDAGDTVDVSPGDASCDDGTGACTLRAAIMEANALPGAQTVELAVPSVTLSLTGTGDDGGDLDVTDDLTLDGAGGTVTQTASDRVLEATSGALTIRDVTITGGTSTAGGGGLRLASGSTLERVTVSGNAAATGGGVQVVAPTTVVDSTISANSASGGGGGIYANDLVSVTTSTISGNSSGNAGGGGIRTGSGTATIVASTVTDNAGHNLYGTIDVAGSIVADPASDTDCAFGTPTSSGHNIASDTSCGFAATGDLTATDPQLSPLADNGGPTATHLPNSGGPAAGLVPTGTAGLCDGAVATDQRGEARPQGTGCDAGAVEVVDGAVVLAVDDGGDSVDALPGDGICDDGTGTCTLRAAIGEANARTGTDTIQIGVASVTLSLTGTGDDGGDLDVSDSLVIEGDGATVTQTVTDRVLEATAGTLTIQDLTITGGDTTSPGGGLRLANATTLERVTVTGNATTGGSGHGGGIAVPGDVTLVDSTVSGNVAAFGGGINVGGTLAVTNSTISGNTATTEGGGLRSGGTAAVVHTTIADNTGSNIAGTVDLTASIVADPATGTDCGDSAPTSSGYNVVSDGSCGFAATGDQTGFTAQLAALADNGGSTLTHLPVTTSLAGGRVPTGTSGLCDGTIATDQRGQARRQGDDCDAGAVEWVEAPLVLTVDDGGDSVDADAGDGVCDDGTGACTLRAAIGEADAWPGVETVQVGVASVTLSLTGTGDDGGDLDVSDSLVIEGNGATVTQTVTDRVLEATSGALTIRDLTMTGGDSTGPGGGLRLANSSILERVTVTGNTTTSGGGGIVNPGPLTVLDSTISGNTAASTGGGINVNASLTISNSTVSGNTSSSGAGGGIGTGATGTATLVHTTVADNTGSNLRHATANSFTVTASIIADPATGTDCTGGGAITSGGYDLASDASCTGFTGTGDLTSTDPLLGALADNGGPTLTHLPDPTGPVSGVIPTGTVGLCDGTVATDQRGEARPDGAGCDPGSVEVFDVPSELTVDDGGDSVDVSEGDGVCDDGTGACTLRAAVMEANALPGAQTLTVTVPTVTLSLSTPDDDGGDLDVTDELIIDGGGATITQTTGERVLQATGGAASFSAADLTITGGDQSGGGGGGIQTAVPTTLERVTVSGNTTGGNNGGGIAALAHLTVIDSTIAGNQSNSSGGGINAEGGLTMVNSTVSGNSAGSNGGVRTFGSAATIVHSTIAANTGTGLTISTPTTVSASILAGNSGGDCSGTATSGGYNIAADATCGFAATGDQTSTDPLLGALADNGGPTFTHLPGVGSPAIDAIPSGAAGLCDGTVAADQRGTARPQGSACDVGAVEQ